MSKSAYEKKRYSANREKILARNRVWEKKNRKNRSEYAKNKYRENADERRRQATERRYKTRYGLTVDAVETLRDTQSNRCRICSGSFEAVEMHVDHDHVSGRVRGLLCENCNLGLGQFQDNVDRLQAAINYLKV